MPYLPFSSRLKANSYLLRSLARTLSIQPGFQKADLFDAINTELGRHQERTGRHPVVILDDCDGLSDELLEDLRLLTNYAMDSEDRFSLILAGTQRLTTRIRQAQNKTLKQRINYSFSLKGFTLKEATDYVHFRVTRAEGPQDLFHAGAVKLLFQLSQGFPRQINQLASHALIQAAVKRKERIDEKFIRQYLLANPMFEAADGGK